MPLERLTFDNGNFKAAMENFKNTKTKERESFDRAITDKNNELNDLQVFFILQTLLVAVFCMLSFDTQLF